MWSIYVSVVFLKDANANKHNANESKSDESVSILVQLKLDLTLFNCLLCSQAWRYRIYINCYTIKQQAILKVHSFLLTCSVRLALVFIREVLLILVGTGINFKMNFLMITNSIITFWWTNFFFSFCSWIRGALDLRRSQGTRKFPHLVHQLCLGPGQWYQRSFRWPQNPFKWRTGKRTPHGTISNFYAWEISNSPAKFSLGRLSLWCYQLALLTLLYSPGATPGG